MNVIKQILLTFVILCQQLIHQRVHLLEYGSLTEALSHYEFLHIDRLRHSVTKRSADGSAHSREVQFDVLGRHFHLRLNRHSSIMSSTFRVVSVDENGLETVETPSPGDYFHGYDLADPDRSRATVYFEDDQTMIASIQDQDETYAIEPSWRHFEKSSNHSMIAYRRSDLNMQQDLGEKFCEGIRVDESEQSSDHSEDVHDQDNIAVSRSRRQVSRSSTYTPAKNTCPLYLVADYRFYQNMGESNVRRTTSYLLSLVDRIDQIYRNTEFSGGIVGMGFEVKEIRIHKKESVVVGGDHYNMNKDWETKELLEVFSRNKDFRLYCLAHLFTYLAFDSGVLGLAYIGSPRSYSVGGICTPVYYKSGRQLYLNTGWSSAINRYNRRLLTEEALLVTTHEFGHNWGSEHDPDTTECSPSASAGGKHIMYTYSVSGYDQNNKIFSNCSRRNIGAVLKTKAPSCFEEESGSFCGNFRIDTSPDSVEECDGGPSGRHGDDLCCNEVCQLRPSAQCSDSNHECCNQCRFLNANAVCHEEQEDACQGESHCPGTSGTCPTPPQRRDNSSCINRGKCRGGRCLSFCESENRLSCVCDSEVEACFWCCKDTPSGECRPHQLNYTLPNGTACITGYCDGQGVCKRQDQDLVQRLWDVIENITPDTVVEFMRANIVGTVIILSLLVWIPASCVICHLDRKKKKEDENHRNWMKNDNHSLVLEEPHRGQGIRLRRAQGLRSRKLPHVIVPRETIRSDVKTTFI